MGEFEVLVRKSIILKGDGVYAYYGGQGHLLTSPPPEALHPDPNTPDVPIYAHYGAYNLTSQATLVWVN